MNVKPVAWWGMMMLVAAEATLFGCLIGTYFYLRFSTAHWPPDGIAKPSVVVPLVLALVLVASVVPLRLGTRWGIALALLLQAGYFAYGVHDFADRLHAFTPQTDAYGSIYYVLLGADHAHVAVGLLFDLWLLVRYRVVALRVVTVYWIAVAVLTLAVTGTLLSARA
jgi:heme/copper-type cytochrome/quinol oxidase subunit 3